MTAYRSFRRAITGLATAFAVTATPFAHADNDTLTIADWSDGELAKWEVEEFSGRTQYQAAGDAQGRWLSALAPGSASGLVMKQTIDLTQTPYINWSWRVRQSLPALDERTKDGDDYAARIYVVVSGGAFFWRTKALNYVWSSNQAPKSSWPNAYTSNAIMFAVRGKQSATGEWVTEKRNVRDDLKAAFGEDFASIDAIAIMTDADNSGARAEADYGPISFTSK